MRLKITWSSINWYICTNPNFYVVMFFFNQFSTNIVTYFFFLKLLTSILSQRIYLEMNLYSLRTLLVQ